MSSLGRINFVCEQTMQSTLRRPRVLFSTLTNVAVLKFSIISGQRTRAYILYWASHTCEHGWSWPCPGPVLCAEVPPIAIDLKDSLLPPGPDQILSLSQNWPFLYLMSTWDHQKLPTEHPGCACQALPLALRLPHKMKTS